MHTERVMGKEGAGGMGHETWNLHEATSGVRARPCLNWRDASSIINITTFTKL